MICSYMGIVISWKQMKPFGGKKRYREKNVEVLEYRGTKAENQSRQKTIYRGSKEEKQK